MWETHVVVFRYTRIFHHSNALYVNVCRRCWINTPIRVAMTMCTSRQLPHLKVIAQNPIHNSSVKYIYIFTKHTTQVLTPLSMFYYDNLDPISRQAMLTTQYCRCKMIASFRDALGPNEVKSVMHALVIYNWKKSY